jgi:hypothetical protein
MALLDLYGHSVSTISNPPKQAWHFSEWELAFLGDFQEIRHPYELSSLQFRFIRKAQRCGDIGASSSDQVQYNEN